MLPVAPLKSSFNNAHDNFMDALKSDASQGVRAHQKEAVHAAYAQLSNPDKHNIALIVLPTGAGKTGVAVMSAYALNASRVLVITPSLTVSQQVSEAFCHSQNSFLVQRGVCASEIFKRGVCPRHKDIKNSQDLREGVEFTSYDLVVTNVQKIGVGEGSTRNITLQDIPRDAFDLVIVDEAHHYPAVTWKGLINHFANSQRLFLTATQFYKGLPLLNYIGSDIRGNHPIVTYELTRAEAVTRRIIRPVCFEECIQGTTSEMLVEDEETRLTRDAYAGIIDLVETKLTEHDFIHPEVIHKAMIITYMVDEARDVVNMYNERTGVPNQCKSFVQGDHISVIDSFKKPNRDTRVLVVCARLLEGFDLNTISVVGIARRIAPSSKVLFAQFVGRCVRTTPTEPEGFTAWVVSSPYFNQRENFNNFEQITDVEPVEEN